MNLPDWLRFDRVDAITVVLSGSAFAVIGVAWLARI